MKIKDLLQASTTTLSNIGVQSARLDTEILLSSALDKDRTWLVAHKDDALSPSIISGFNSLLEQRADRIPLAYIIGKKEFYGRDFIVNPDVLIPRPETEQIIDFLKNNTSTPRSILDVGTGSGAIAVTLSLELNSRVTASDISLDALSVARRNAKKLKADVSFLQSNLLDGISDQFDVIVANLPYVDKTWEVSRETAFEPDLALFSDDDGMSLVKKLIEQAPSHLTSNGRLVLEIDPRQDKPIIQFAKVHGLSTAREQPFMLVLQR